MTSTKKQIIGLGLVILIAAFIYLWKISIVPSSLYADETTVGYNAYSILQTGKDEYGKSFPILFRLFGAYTPPLFVYVLTPFISFFGLNSFALRLPSALATLGLILVVFLFVKKLNFFKNSYSALLASLIFAISPWVVFNARLGYEVTLGYVLFYIGVYFLWQGLDKNNLSLTGLLFLSLSTYTAHTERYLVPLFLSLFLIIFRQKIFNKTYVSHLATTFIICLTTQIPHFTVLSSPAFWVKNTSFAASNISAGLWDFINQLVIYLSPQTYFGSAIQDINLQHFIPEISLFYSWQIIPFLVGLYFLLKTARSADNKLILLLLLASPIPGAMSGHFISIQRVLPIIVPIVLIIALGIEKLFVLVPKKFGFISILLAFALLLFSLVLLWRSYFVLLPGLWSKWWNFGAKEIAQFISQNNQSKIIIDNSRDQALYSPIIFYLQYPPDKFQPQFTHIATNYYHNPTFSSTVTFGNTTTRPINWETDPLVDAFLVGDTLSISEEQAKEHFLAFVYSIKDKTDKVHFNIYKTNPTLKKQDNTKKQQKNYNN